MCHHRTGTFRASLQVKITLECSILTDFEFIPHIAAVDEVENYLWSEADIMEGISKSGPKSIHFDSKSVAHLEDIYLQGSINLHFFVLSDSDRQEMLRFEGYRSGTRVVLKEENIFVLDAQWNEVTLEIDAPLIDSIKISFRLRLRLSVDELQINSMN